MKQYVGIVAILAFAAAGCEKEKSPEELRQEKTSADLKRWQSAQARNIINEIDHSDNISARSFTRELKEKAKAVITKPSGKPFHGAAFRVSPSMELDYTAYCADESNAPPICKAGAAKRVIGTSSMYPIG